jgi:hypothetical protein
MEDTMKLGVVLTLSALYMAAIGLITLFAPHVLTLGAVEASAPATVLFSLRIPASMALGIAVINLMTRSAGPSEARNAVTTGNIVGFGLATLLGLWGVFSGAPALAWAFVIVHALFCVGFLLSGRGPDEVPDATPPAPAM